MGVPVSNCSALAYYPSQRLVAHNTAPKLRQNRFKYSATPTGCLLPKGRSIFLANCRLVGSKKESHTNTNGNFLRPKTSERKQLTARSHEYEHRRDRRKRIPS